MPLEMVGTTCPASPMSLEEGQLLDGKYAIRRLIGRGGMGNVYEGENVLIHRRVAIKVLNAEVAKDPMFVTRFEREAQAAGRIGSDHIVEVLDLGTLPSGERFMVMEYLQGESLSERMQAAERMSPSEVFPICIGLLEGLSDAHAAGILHRDLKPANVFLTNDRQQADFVKILDFGVSKFMDLTGDDATATGVTLGTPRYMAPEQARGDKDIDFRADLYAVGVILFRALTGRPPFIADTYNELMFKVVLEDPPSLSELVTDADPTIVRLVAKAMDRDRDQRFQSADELAAELARWLEAHGQPVPVRASTRRHRLTSSESLTRISVPDFPIESTSTQHATTVVSEEPPPRRRPWLVVMAMGALVLSAFVTVRVLSVMAEPDAPSASEPAEEGALAPSSVGEADAAASASVRAALPAPVAATSGADAAAAPSAEPDASSSAARVGPPAPWTPGVRAPTPGPQPTPGQGPTRKYRRKL